MDLSFNELFEIDIPNRLTQNLLVCVIPRGFKSEAFTIQPAQIGCYIHNQTTIEILQCQEPCHFPVLTVSFDGIYKRFSWLSG